MAHVWLSGCMKGIAMPKYSALSNREYKYVPQGCVLAVPRPVTQKTLFSFVALRVLSLPNGCTPEDVPLYLHISRGVRYRELGIGKI